MSTDTLQIHPLKQPFDVTLPMPGSKSHSNRAILAACLTPGTVHITGATPCDDVVLLVANLQKMGFDLRWTEPTTGQLMINGGLPRQPCSETRTLHCENAGTTLRFLTTLACLVPGEWIVTGNEHMLKRPIGSLTAALKQLGAIIEDTAGCPPLRIRGGTLQGGTVTLDASKSSQFLSSLLLTSPILPTGLTVQVPGELASPGYIDLTLQTMRDFGIETTAYDQTFSVQPQPYRSPGMYHIEGDWSAAGAWLVLAVLTNSRIHCPNLSQHSRQSDRLLPAVIANLQTPGDRIIDCSDIPDQVMNISVLAAHRPHRTRLVGAANLRLKECNRLAVTVQEFSKLGIVIEEEPDGLLIEGQTHPRPGAGTISQIPLNPHADHRMAMAFAILGSIRPGIGVQQISCVSKSYPHFFADLQKAHNSPRCIAIIGMRGAGKTSLAKRLGKKLRLPVVDTDQVFTREHGPIADIVQQHGWAAFRSEEERIVAQCLQPGRVIALGGGAVESTDTRRELKKRAVTVWLQADEKRILSHLRLSRRKRPALTNLPVDEEVKQKLMERNPLYAEIATITLPQSIPYDRQVRKVTEGLQSLCSW